MYVIMEHGRSYDDAWSAPIAVTESEETAKRVVNEKTALAKRVKTQKEAMWKEYEDFMLQNPRRLNKGTRHRPARQVMQTETNQNTESSSEPYRCSLEHAGRQAVAKTLTTAVATRTVVHL